MFTLIVSPVIKRYCCTKEWLCTSFRSRFKFWMKVTWFQIGQQALQWQRVFNKKELYDIDYLPAPAWDVPAAVDLWHCGGKAQCNKWIAAGTQHQSKKDQILKDVQKIIIIQAHFTGQASEPKEASKWQCGTIEEAFLNFSLVWDCYKAGKGDLILLWSFHSGKSLELTHSKPMAQSITKVRFW